MRSVAELVFRARQEAANLRLLASPPVFGGTVTRPLSLPDPAPVIAALRESEFARFVTASAEQILEHRLPLFGAAIETGPEVRWRRDYRHGIESGIAYFRRIPYLNFSAAGDHKFVWELNRHQHLVLLAQAFRLTGRPEFIREIFRHIESWLDENPFPCGINWTSALEVAFRSLSWIWVYHLVGAETPEQLRQRFLTGLYRHGRYLTENLSIYFSPNTHLLGEAVALHALGALFEEFPESDAWRRRGAEIVQAQLTFQVHPDGSHFEQSTYYHIYALDLFLFHYLLAGRPAAMRDALTGMAEYLHWLLGPNRQISCFGDDDGGRLFHPYGERDRFGRATLTTCGLLFGRGEWTGEETAEQAAWWMGGEALGQGAKQYAPVTDSRLFAGSGSAFLQAGNLWVQVDAGPFGFGGAGHSHSDTLSLVVWLGGERVLIDPGTYTYVAEPEERAWFRGSAAHNTVRIDKHDQARPAGPFRWASKPEVVVEKWEAGPARTRLEACCRYENFTHRRRILLEPGRLLVIDEIEGPPGEHVCEQIWQLGPAAAKVKLEFSAAAAAYKSKFSPVYGTQCQGTAMISSIAGQLPVRLAMLLETGETPAVSIEEALRSLNNLMKPR
ncbi:MAG: alginate lyase family protein [Bryobacteraceae bacterium]